MESQKRNQISRVCNTVRRKDLEYLHGRDADNINSISDRKALTWFKMYILPATSFFSQYMIERGCKMLDRLW
jgi:hypothetical protein